MQDYNEAEEEEEEGNFGLGSGIQGPKTDIGVEDEDEFEIDDDLVVSIISSSI